MFDERCDEVKRIEQNMRAALVAEDWPLLLTLNESLELELKCCSLSDCSSEQKKVWQKLLSGVKKSNKQILSVCFKVKDEAAKALALVKKQRGAESAYQQIQASSPASKSGQ